MSGKKGFEDVVGDRALVLDERFAGKPLDPSRWIPQYLPQWSAPERSTARARLDGSGLELRIDADQPMWSPEYAPGLVVSSVQTGTRSGPVGSSSGQHPFRPGLRVLTPQASAALVAPRRGAVSVRMTALGDPALMVALWLIGLEDEPSRSGELCVAEIFGRDVRSGSARVGMGLHPWNDPGLREDFARVELPIDARAPHEYAADWADDGITWYVDDRPVRRSGQSPDYPMQIMLGVFEDRGAGGAAGYPQRMRVERLRVWEPA